MILVTGAGGLVGSHLVKQLVSEGNRVRAIYRSAIPLPEVAGTVEWVKGDILDVVSLEEAMKGIQQVYHCAAIVTFNPKKKALLHQTNVEGTANVVNACLNEGISKLLFVSSVAALGRIREDIPIDEKMNWSEETSNSEYGKSKYFAEMEVWRGIGEGLNAVIVNPVIILGAGDWTKGSSEIFKSAYDEFPWYTEGISGFVDVIDVVRAMILLMGSNCTAERYILSAEDLPFREVFTRIAINFGKKPPNRKVTPLIAALVWRIEAVKARFTGKDPLLTRETARTAAAKVHFDNNKFKLFFVNFKYTPVTVSLKRICQELKNRYGL
ncbi:MAG: NAD-dependent epimerase/dehydratase family protein [Sediminibacterium sp.]|nr:NAD-dependent epimerase/dehydratase family protein [Sediminibacterium sp.]MDP3129440.1 NAD-dependent epimerase/dehydratase family protein [Sediminibacterium sp.]